MEGDRMQSETMSSAIERGRPPLAGRTPAGGTANGPATAPTSPAAPAAQTPATDSAGAGRQQSDAPWSTVFGSPTLPSGCRTVAVDGSTVYLGGDFIYG